MNICIFLFQYSINFYFFKFKKGVISILIYLIVSVENIKSGLFCSFFKSEYKKCKMYIGHMYINRIEVILRIIIIKTTGPEVYRNKLLGIQEF